MLKYLPSPRFIIAKYEVGNVAFARDSTGLSEIACTWLTETILQYYYYYCVNKYKKLQPVLFIK